MNAKKGKGKPRPNKEPNPELVKKEDPIEIGKVENVPEEKAEIESAQKCEDRVPEIISEIIPSPVIDTDKEDDGPKKPKRNRGKKKKQDKDESETQDQPSEIVGTHQLEIIEVESQEPPVEEDISPSARKKKNKNKKTSHAEPKASEPAVVPPEIKKTDDAAEEHAAAEIKKHEEVVDQEAKGSKKKNKKKKNRTDSERSDVKAEEISCTSAFQMLLKDDKIDAKVDKSEPKPADVAPIEIQKSEGMNISAFIQELEKVEDIDYVSQEPKSGGKGKKKNKKDKKEALKESEPGMTTEISYMTAIKPIPKEESAPKKGKEIKNDDPPEDITKVDTVSIDDDKPKAKIAKPVERKRKGKNDKQEELPSEIESEIKPTAISEPIKRDDISTVDISQTGKIEDFVTLPESVVLEENKQNIPKPTDKKKKGKGKHVDESIVETIQSKDTMKKDETVLVSSGDAKTVEISKGEIKDSESLPEKVETTTDSKNKVEQGRVSPQVEKKRKGKKDPRDQVSLKPTDDKNSDRKSPLKDPLKPADIYKDTVSLEMKEALKKEEKQFKDQELEFEDEMILEPITDIGIVDNPIKCELIKDMPLIPEPIESIQTKLELLPEIATTPSNVKADVLKETSFIDPPPGEMGKKRKKSPKPPKRDQKPIKEEPKPEIMPATQSSSKEDMPIQGEVKLDENICPPVTKLSEPERIQEETKSSDIIEATTTMASLLDTEDITPFETKLKKKRKKSPKLPQEPESITKTLNKDIITLVDSPVENIPKEENMGKLTGKTQETGDKGDIFYDMPSDIEISSLKADESEGSTCGFTPDIIQYPRATSQNLIDNNNNSMLIQEITIAEEAKLQIPMQVPDTPLIQGSGTTPLEAPGNIFVGIKISEVETSKPEPEKTDLKSKMMEVNQDMEELRLSIERSLAELTAIEKSEGEVEKLFENRSIATEEIKPTEVKICMPSEIIAKNQPEKVATPKTHPKHEKAQKVKNICDIKDSQTEFQKHEKNVNTPEDNKSAETIIPPKTSMFFNKELKDMDVLLKPDLIKQELISSPHSSQATAKACDFTLPVTISSTKNISKPTENIIEAIIPPIPPIRKDNKSSSKERESKESKGKGTSEVVPILTTPSTESPKPPRNITETAPPVCPARKDNKNKGKNKKKGKQEASETASQTESSAATAPTDSPKENKKEEKTAQTSEPTTEKGKKQTDKVDDSETKIKEPDSNTATSEFDPIENFEDAMTSSADDINRTFEIIADEASRSMEASNVNPEIKIVAPVEDKKKHKRDEKINPVSQPKNLLGHPDIPVRLNKTDFKKEKNKTPNTVSAKVKIKDSVEIERKQSKDTQTDNIKKFLKSKSIDESFSSVTNEDDEFVYKYSFRKVFLQSACHVCKKDLKQSRVPCNFCNLVFYCNAKHKDEDYPQHQGLCFAISTIVHLKDQKHIYADAQNVTGQDYRLLRMQMIVSCERVLKRKLCAWEQEALLYPRMCASAACREWRQSKLADCDGCGQISFCANNPSHLPKNHQRWCKSYALYQKLVCHQQTKGRLEPKLPSKVMMDPYRIPDKINEALASMYEEKIDMNDIQYAALTQIATAPLTAAYCHQTYASTSQANGTYKKSTCTVHVVGGELQFEAGALNKWEVFFLHLRPQLQELRVVMVGAELNPSNLPLDLLGKVKLCETCTFNKRRLVFSFQDKMTYHEYRASDEFLTPDIVCAFNPSIKRSSMYNGNDPWPKTISCVSKMKIPFLVTSYTMNEIQRDLARIKECSEMDVKVVIEPQLNSFASVRPDRNFISDDEMPLLFKNYCYTLVCGVN